MMDANEMTGSSQKKLKLPPNLQRNSNRSVDPRKKHKMMSYPLTVQNPAFLETTPQFLKVKDKRYSYGINQIVTRRKSQLGLENQKGKNSQYMNEEESDDEERAVFSVNNP